MKILCWRSNNPWTLSFLCFQ